MKKIYVITPFHTGTWFVLKMLSDHPEVKGFLQMIHVKEASKQAGIVKRHNLTADGKVYLDEQIKDINGYVVIHNHVVPGSFIETFLLADRAIVTIRDPLLSLMTRRERELPGQTNNPIELYVNQFLFLARLFNNLKIETWPFIFPIDLLNTREERYFKLHALLSFCGLSPWPHAAKWAEFWPTNYNTKGEYEAKKYYREKDISYFEKNYKNEMKSLYGNEIELKPFLKSIGYKNLFWWGRNGIN